ncbi:peptidoglycan DD-metalloendopeptidase family protein [Radiobacillus sp. PE A8.2]|uniref:peptidoglycan DD-metalloendopeptidase family protein n=1 Tax=Radiobacillus sp. PE A8.2 TaxID=3380349 RepID=UPI00388F2806
MWNNKKGKENQLNNLYPQQAYHKPYSLLKKTAITTFIGVGLTFNIAFANDDGLSTIFHVYVDGEHVGQVDSKEVIQAYVDKRVSAQQEQNKDLAFTVGEEISYVPEMVFEASAKNEQVLNQLDEEISIKVDAYQLKIADKVVGNFKDKETAEAVVTYFESKYVDLETLNKIKDASQQYQAFSDEVIPEPETELKLGESKVLDVTLSEEVSYSSEKISADQVLTEKQGRRLLEKGTLQDQLHKVEKGEVLGAIASKYNLTMDELLKINPSLKEDSILQIGQEINVTDYQPFLDVFVKEEKLVEEQIAYEKEVVTSDELYKGDTTVRQKGQEGTKEVHYAIEKENGSVISQEIIEQNVTKEPVKEIIVKGTKVVPSRGTGEFKWPTVGGRITSYVGSRWGSYHKALDIAGVSNRSIMAIDNGVVEFAGWQGSYGNKVVINHKNGYKSVYAHLSSINVSVGQTVVRGKTIGIMGTTGNSTGIHLHLEVYKNGSLITSPQNLF